MEIIEDGGAGKKKVHVAVGKSVAKGVVLLKWVLRRFPDRDICIVHLHQPSPWIPTLLGNLPASQASIEVLSAYRRDEKRQMKKLLVYYMSICCQPKVKVSVIAAEASQVRRGIVDLVSKYGIWNLVMGASPESGVKVKGNSSNAGYVAKYAPQFSEIWFVNKGKHAWKKDAYKA